MAAHLTLATLANHVGQEVGVSEWHEIQQQQISDFAEVTKDFQYIHTDPVRAANSPFGGTIAHGFLVLSLLSAMFEEALGALDGTTMSMNYGLDGLRFLTPVKNGAQIGARFTLKSVTERQPGQWRATFDTTVEIKGQEKPALVAQWVILLFA